MQRPFGPVKPIVDGWTGHMTGRVLDIMSPNKHPFQGIIDNEYDS